jgi:hypothetical protein
LGRKIDMVYLLVGCEPARPWLIMYYVVLPYCNFKLYSFLNKKSIVNL